MILRVVGGVVEVEELNVTSNGTYEAPEGRAYNPVIVDVSGGGGGSETRACNFFDYDGTLLHSYTTDEVAALTELPANPSHTGLTAQGWTHTLAQVKETVEAVGACDVGQMYVTSDGKTRIYIHVDEGEPVNERAAGIALLSESTASCIIDWGDGSEVEDNTVEGQEISNHTYANPGDYIVTIEVTSGEIGIIFNDDISEVYARKINKFEIGEGVGNIGFGICFNLESVVIPDGVTSIGDYAFQNCFNLESVVIPDGVTSISVGMFSGCVNLESIVIPSSITSIGDDVFFGCSKIREIHLESTTPPTLGSVAFYVYRNDFAIYVPQSENHAVLDAYKSASGWSDYAGRIKEEGDIPDPDPDPDPEPELL